MFAENKYENIFSRSIIFIEDSASHNINDINYSDSLVKYKAPGKSLLFSGLVPGLGQAYTGNWIRALLFLGLDAAALATWKLNNDKAEEKKQEYNLFA